MTRAVLLLVVVLVTYAILFFRARGKRIAKGVASVAERTKREAEVVVAKSIAALQENPYTPKPDLIDQLMPTIEKVAGVVGIIDNDPIMRERLNEGSDKFFEAEELRRADAMRGKRKQFRLPGEPPPGVPDDLELARNLWPKPKSQAPSPPKTERNGGDKDEDVN